MVKTRGTKVKPIFGAALLLAVVVITGCAIKSRAADSAPDGALKVASVSQSPTIDGKDTEGVWKEAPALSVQISGESGVRAKEVTLKAVQTGDMVYLLARYEDTTPLKIGEPWKFDGTKWVKGSYDDTLAFVWDMGIPGFKTNGMGVMDEPLVKPMDVFGFTKTENRNGSLKEQADMWGWCGMPEFYGRGDDMVFALNPAAVQSESMPAVYVIQHDQHANGKPWVLNEVEVNGVPAPRYKYREGLNLTNTPRPFMDQVEEVTDYNGFKPGDQAPHVVGIRDANWGGSKDDILVKGMRDGSDWVVEFGRKLDTGNPDDVALKSSGSFTFVVIVRDDAKGYAVSRPVTADF